MDVFGKGSIKLIAFPLLKFLLFTLSSLDKRFDIISSLFDVVNNSSAHRCIITDALNGLVVDYVSELDIISKVVVARDLLGEPLNILEGPLALDFLVLINDGLKFNFILRSQVLIVFLSEGSFIPLSTGG